MASEQPKVLLTRRELLKTGAAAAVLAVLSVVPRPGSMLASDTAQAAPAGAWNHDPTSPIGPRHWAEIGFPTCGQGMRQSPVDISTDKVAAYRGAPLVLRYESSELVVENTGHVVEVPIPADVHDTLQIGGDRYGLAQYHFHAPSEHAVNGRRAAVEAHFVHTRCWTGSCCRRPRRRARRPTPEKPTRPRCSATSEGSARSAEARSASTRFMPTMAR